MNISMDRATVTGRSWIRVDFSQWQSTSHFLNICYFKNSSTPQTFLLKDVCLEPVQCQRKWIEVSSD